MKKLFSLLKVVSLVLAALLVLYGLVWAFYGRIVYHFFYRSSGKEVAIPGLRSGFIPQGVSVGGDGITLVCGYYTGKKASSIFVLRDDSVTEISLLTEDGKTYTGHAGGLTAVGEYLYVSNASKLFMVPLSSVLSANDGDSIAFISHLEVPCRASFCSSSEGMLYVGEFHEKGYGTDESHRVKTKDGGTYQAMAFGYPVDEKGRVTGGPTIVYALPDKVQGFAKRGDTVVLSCSYGRWFPSHLYSYRTTGSDRTFLLDGKELPLLILDSSRLTDTLKMPHMSEDVEFRGNELFVAFEAGSSKYGGGILPATIKSVMKIAF